MNSAVCWNLMLTFTIYYIIRPGHPALEGLGMSVAYIVTILVMVSDQQVTNDLYGLAGTSETLRTVSLFCALGSPLRGEPGQVTPLPANTSPSGAGAQKEERGFNE